MGKIVNHPRKPPPTGNEATAPDVAAIRKRAANMRIFFDSLVGEYANAALRGRLHAWGEAAHAYIDLVSERADGAVKSNHTSSDGGSDGG